MFCHILISEFDDANSVYAVTVGLTETVLVEKFQKISTTLKKSLNCRSQYSYDDMYFDGKIIGF